MINKLKIIDMFKENVLGKKFDPVGYNIQHDGKEGHWLERAMGISANADNKPDILGYEMKTSTPSKTTFGDWSPKDAIFKRAGVAGKRVSRDKFLEIFGKPNLNKQGRFSWSGDPIPKINYYNSFGQILYVDVDNNIFIKYSFSKDQRKDKKDIVPDEFQTENLILAIWPANYMRLKVENKFSQNGWFKCFKDKDGKYYKIGFAPPFNYYQWITRVKRGIIFFDSGMYQGNRRPYSHWRASNKYWDSLITEYYPK